MDGIPCVVLSLAVILGALAQHAVVVSGGESSSTSASSSTSSFPEYPSSTISSNDVIDKSTKSSTLKQKKPMTGSSGGLPSYIRPWEYYTVSPDAVDPVETHPVEGATDYEEVLTPDSPSVVREPSATPIKPPQSYGYNFYSKYPFNNPDFVQNAFAHRVGMVQPMVRTAPVSTTSTKAPPDPQLFTQGLPTSYNSALVYINNPPGGFSELMNRHAALGNQVEPHHQSSSLVKLNQTFHPDTPSPSPDINGLIMQALQANLISSQALHQLALPVTYLDRTTQAYEYSTEQTQEYTSEKLTSQGPPAYTSMRPGPGGIGLPPSPKPFRIAPPSLSNPGVVSITVDDTPLMPSETPPTFNHSELPLASTTETAPVVRPVQVSSVITISSSGNSTFGNTTLIIHKPLNKNSTTPKTPTNGSATELPPGSPSKVTISPLNIKTSSRAPFPSKNQGKPGLHTTPIKLVVKTTTRRVPFPTTRLPTDRPIITAIVDRPIRRTTTRPTMSRPIFANVGSIHGLSENAHLYGEDPNEIIIIGIDGSKTQASKRPTTMRPKTTTIKHGHPHLSTRRPVLTVTKKATSRPATTPYSHKTMIPEYVGLLGESGFIFANGDLIVNDRTSTSSTTTTPRPTRSTTRRTTTTSTTTTTTTQAPSFSHRPPFPTRRRTTTHTPIRFSSYTEPTTSSTPVSIVSSINNRPSQQNPSNSPATTTRPNGFRQLIYALGLALIPTTIIALFAGLPGLLLGRRKRDVDSLLSNKTLNEVVAEIERFVRFADFIEDAERGGDEEPQKHQRRKRQSDNGGFMQSQMQGGQQGNNPFVQINTQSHQPPPGGHHVNLAGQIAFPHVQGQMSMQGQMQNPLSGLNPLSSINPFSGLSSFGSSQQQSPVNTLALESALSNPQIQQALLRATKKKKNQNLKKKANRKKFNTKGSNRRHWKPMLQAWMPGLRRNKRDADYFFDELMRRQGHGGYSAAAMSAAAASATGQAPSNFQDINRHPSQLFPHLGHTLTELGMAQKPVVQRMDTAFGMVNPQHPLLGLPLLNPLQGHASMVHNTGPHKIKLPIDPVFKEYLKKSQKRKDTVRPGSSPGMRKTLRHWMRRQKRDADAPEDLARPPRHYPRDYDGYDRFDRSDDERYQDFQEGGGGGDYDRGGYPSDYNNRNDQRYNDFVEPEPYWNGQAASSPNPNNYNPMNRATSPFMGAGSSQMSQVVSPYAPHLGMSSFAGVSQPIIPASHQQIAMKSYTPGMNPQMMASQAMVPNVGMVPQPYGGVPSIMGQQNYQPHADPILNYFMNMAHKRKDSSSMSGNYNNKPSGQLMPYNPNSGSSHHHPYHHQMKMPHFPKPFQVNKLPRRQSKNKRTRPRRAAAENNEEQLQSEESSSFRSERRLDSSSGVVYPVEARQSSGSSGAQMSNSHPGGGVSTGAQSSANNPFGVGLGNMPNDPLYHQFLKLVAGASKKKNSKGMNLKKLLMLASHGFGAMGGGGSSGEKKKAGKKRLQLKQVGHQQGEIIQQQQQQATGGKVKSAKSNNKGQKASKPRIYHYPSVNLNMQQQQQQQSQQQQNQNQPQQQQLFLQQQPFQQKTDGNVQFLFANNNPQQQQQQNPPMIPTPQMLIASANAIIGQHQNGGGNSNHQQQQHHPQQPVLIQHHFPIQLQQQQQQQSQPKIDAFPQSFLIQQSPITPILSFAAQAHQAHQQQQLQQQQQQQQNAQQDGTLFPNQQSNEIFGSAFQPSSQLISQFLNRFTSQLDPQQQASILNVANQQQQLLQQQQQQQQAVNDQQQQQQQQVQQQQQQVAAAAAVTVSGTQETTVNQWQPSQIWQQESESQTEPQSTFKK